MMNLAPSFSLRVVLHDDSVAAAAERLTALLRATSEYMEVQELGTAIRFTDHAGLLTVATEYRIDIEGVDGALHCTITARSSGFAIGDVFGGYRRRALKVASLISTTESFTSVPRDQQIRKDRDTDGPGWWSFVLISLLVGGVLGALGRLPTDSTASLAVSALALAFVLLARILWVRRQRKDR